MVTAHAAVVLASKNAVAVFCPSAYLVHGLVGLAQQLVGIHFSACGCAFHPHTGGHYAMPGRSGTPPPRLWPAGVSMGPTHRHWQVKQNGHKFIPPSRASVSCSFAQARFMWPASTVSRWSPAAWPTGR